MSFHKTSACVSRKHCAKCRDTGKPGVVWRNAMAQTFEFDPAAACPFGIEWGATVAPVPVAINGNPALAKSCLNGDGPGTLVKSVLASFGIVAGPNCGCEQMCLRMNDWGWQGCLAHLPTLIGWFSGKAVEAGKTISVVAIGRRVAELIKGGLATVPEQGKDGDLNGGSTAV